MPFPRDGGHLLLQHAKESISAIAQEPACPENEQSDARNQVQSGTISPTPYVSVRPISTASPSSGLEQVFQYVHDPLSFLAAGKNAGYQQS